ncbi:MAG: phage gp6-like head-tail connector protein [Sphingobacteriia bacterium]|nr:phage gp6-like head-tail connector protein [Sphingobacteriia bacterium]
MEYTKYYSLEKIAVASNPVISLEEVKQYLRVEHNDEDEIIKDMILAALQTAEQFLNIEIIPKKYIAKYQNILLRKCILPLNPISKINAIRIKNYNEIKLITNFEMTNDKILNFKDLIYTNELEIDFTTGFENTEVLPKFIKQGVLLHTLKLYERKIDAFDEIYLIYQPYKKIRI